MYKFSLKIDDEEHSLTSENGLSFKDLSALLNDLYNVIDPDSGVICTLSQIRGNCYALDFSTEEAQFESNFVRVHKNLEQIPIQDLEKGEAKYAKTIKKILGDKFYMNAYDGNNNKVAQIKSLGVDKEFSTYYTYETVYGVLSELGSKKLDSSSKHIFIDGYNEKIFVPRDLDIKLKEHYGTRRLRVELRQKRSFVDGHVIRAELKSFSVTGDRDLVSNLNQEKEQHPENRFAGINSVEDILNKLYGYTS